MTLPGSRLYLKHLLSLFPFRHHQIVLFSRDNCACFSHTRRQHSVLCMELQPLWCEPFSVCLSKSPKKQCWRCHPTSAKTSQKLCQLISDFSKATSKRSEKQILKDSTQVWRERFRVRYMAMAWLNISILKKKHRTGHRICFSTQIQTSSLFLCSHSPQILFFPTSLLLVLFTPAAWFPPV